MQLVITMASGASTISILLLVCLLALISSDVAAAGHGGGGFDSLFNVMNFEAYPGSNKPSTQAFIKAWDAACNSPGRSRVFVPPGVYRLGETTFQGPCKSDKITVYIAGTLQAVSDISEYSGNGWISFDSVNGLIVTGGGTIDGQGQEVWEYNDCKANTGCVHLPPSLYFNNVRDAKVMKVNILNSMGFHMHITSSYLFRAHGLKITAPATSPNTDGIHISKSNTVKIARSVIATGDDCISIGQGSTNVTVTKVTCGPGHGISVGSLGKVPNEMDVNGLIVKNCTLIGTTNGVRIKTYPASDPSRASGMLFSNIVMDNVANPIIINQNYGSKKTEPSRVHISDVMYQNIRGTTITPLAVNLMCSPSVPCSNVKLSDVNLRLIGNTRLASACANAQVSQTGIVIPPPCL